MFSADQKTWDKIFFSSLQRGTMSMMPEHKIILFVTMQLDLTVDGDLTVTGAEPCLSSSEFSWDEFGQRLAENVMSF